MATSVVNRVIEPTKPNYGKGDMVIGSTGIVVVCTGKRNNTEFEGVVVYPAGGYPIGDHMDTWSKGSFKPFKGSITLTEA